MVMRQVDSSDLSVVTGYDLLGRVCSVGTPDDPVRFVAYEYDASSLVTCESLNSGAIERRFTHTPLGEFHESDDPYLTQAVSYRRGGVATGAYLDGNVTQERFVFKDDRFAGLGSKPQSYLYDYTYDDFGRLTGARARQGQERRLDWDVVVGDGGPGFGQGAYTADEGLVSLERGGDRQVYEYEPGRHRLAALDDGSVAAFVYGRDGAVRAVPERGLAALEYDASDGLTREIRTTAGEAMRYGRFDGGHKASRRVDDGGATCFFGHGLEPLLAVDDVDGEVRYVYSGGRLVSLERQGGWHFVVDDRLGSSRVLVGSDGEPDAFFNYGPFGTMLPGNADEGEAPWFDKRYTGQTWNDGQQLYDYHARQYDPALGRFLQVDPKHQTADPYAYVGNNPIMHTDPTGMWFGWLTDGWTESWEEAWRAGTGRLNALASGGESGLTAANTVAATGIKNLPLMEQLMLPLKYGFGRGMGAFWRSGYGLSTVARLYKWIGSYLVGMIAGHAATHDWNTGVEVGLVSLSATMLQDITFQKVGRPYLLFGDGSASKHIQAMLLPHFLFYGSIGFARAFLNRQIMNSYVKRNPDKGLETRPAGDAAIAAGIAYASVWVEYAIRVGIKYKAKGAWSTTARRSASDLLEKANPHLDFEKDTGRFSKGRYTNLQGRLIPDSAGGFERIFPTNVKTLTRINVPAVNRAYYFATPATPPRAGFAAGKVALRVVTESVVLGVKAQAIKTMAPIVDKVKP